MATELDLFNALIYSGGIPPMSSPDESDSFSDVELFQQLELYLLGAGEDITIDIVGNALRRLAEEYKREPVT